MNHNQNFVQDGMVLNVTMPYARASSGLGVKVGAIFGVTMDGYANAAEGRIECCGVHELAKTSAQAWTQGQRLFWDDTNKRLDSDSAVGMYVGYATEAAANPSSTGKVRLCPSGPLAEGAQATIAALTVSDAVALAAADATIADAVGAGSVAPAAVAAYAAVVTMTNPVTKAEGEAVSAALAAAVLSIENLRGIVASLVTDLGVANQNLADLAVKQNEFRTKLIAAGIIAAA